MSIKRGKASINTTIRKCPGWCTCTCHTSCAELSQLTEASSLPMSLPTSHGTPCSPLGRNHLHPDPEQPRGLARHCATKCSVLLPTTGEPHYAGLGEQTPFCCIMEPLSLTRIKHPVRGALENARWYCIVLMSLNGNCQWSWWNKYGKGNYCNWLTVWKLPHTI